MQCKKCGREIVDESLFCQWCGAAQGESNRTRKKRGNGQGSVYKRGKTWYAARVFGYITGENGEIIPDKDCKGGFRTKKEAIDYLPQLKPHRQSKSPHKIPEDITVKGMYDLWMPTHKARGKSKSTIGCYTAAINHFEEIWDYPFVDAGIDDWQECIDDCPRGRRTRENMKALVGLLYKYAIPRGATPDKINLGEYLYVTGESGRRHPFTDLEVETIRQSIGTVPYADYIYCMIYLGYRPQEMLTREIDKHYNPAENCIIGGIKTDAGKNRVVTISPKIQPHLSGIIGGRKSGYIFCAPDGSKISVAKYRACFYEAIDKMGIKSTPERKLTPYSCRHTFASLMDRVKGAGDNAKMELIGHRTIDMLRHYQHADLDDLRKITDAI